MLENNKKHIFLMTVLRATLNKQIVAFVESGDKQLTFPSSLTTCQRKIIHELAEAAGLHHESHGRNQRRQITVINKNYQPAPTQPDPIVTFSLKLTLDKEYNLADLIPSVTIPDSDPFNISFHLVKHDMVLGNISFTNLHTCPPFHNQLLLYKTPVCTSFHTGV